MHPRATEGRVRQARREVGEEGTLDQQRAAFEKRVRNRALVAHAEARMKERPRMHRAEERRRVAEKLWLLLDEIERGPRGVTKARVLQKAIGAKPEDSTKHLPRYALRPSEDPLVSDQRAGYLLKTATKFVRIARVAAELAEMDADEAVLRVLDRTYYTEDPPQEALAEDRNRRAEALRALLADIAARLFSRHPVGAGIERMEQAGWTCRAPGDLTSAMRVDPALLGWGLTGRGLPTVGEPPRPPYPHDIWRNVERYPHVHIGYVSGECLWRAEVGRVVGRIVFRHQDGTQFETDVGAIVVRCKPVWRVDLVLANTGARPSSRWSPANLAFAFSTVTWVQPTERLSWTSPTGAEYWIAKQETLGEVDRWLTSRDKAGAGGPHRGVLLHTAHQDWGSGSWVGSLKLITDEDGQLVNAPRSVRCDNVTDASGGSNDADRSGGRTVLTAGPTLMFLDGPVLHRHFASNARIAHLWTDERPDGPPYADHLLAADPVPYAETLEPVPAPEGSLSARLERWLQGALANRSTLEADLDAAVVAFLERIRLTEAEARERLTSAVYGKRS